MKEKTPKAAAATSARRITAVSAVPILCWPATCRTAELDLVETDGAEADEGCVGAGAEPESGTAVLPDICELLLAARRPEESVSRRRRFRSARISAAT